MQRIRSMLTRCAAPYCYRLYQHTIIASMIIFTLQNINVDRRYTVCCQNKKREKIIALLFTLHKSFVLDTQLTWGVLLNTGTTGERRRERGEDREALSGAWTTLFVHSQQRPSSDYRSMVNYNFPIWRIKVIQCSILATGHRERLKPNDPIKGELALLKCLYGKTIFDYFGRS